MKKKSKNVKQVSRAMDGGKKKPGNDNKKLNKPKRVTGNNIPDCAEVGLKGQCSTTIVFEAERMTKPYGNNVTFKAPPDALAGTTAYAGILPDQDSELESEGIRLSDVRPDFTYKERLFIFYFVTGGRNKTQAALDAGYSPRSAYQSGYENMKKPEIKAEVDRLITERLMPKDEVLQRLSQMARSNLNDYLVTVERAVRPTIKVSLRVVINKIRERIEDQAKFIQRANITDKDRLKAFAGNLVRWNEEIIEMEIELERNPGAYREQQGPEVIEQVVELDVIKLMRDKERGLIKSLKRNRNGEIEVELYGADGALRDIGRYHGIFEKDNRRLNLISEVLTADDVKRINEGLERDY